MDTADKGHTGCSRTHRPAPATEAKYSRALELYATTSMSIRAICTQSEVSYPAFQSYLYKYHRDLLLARYGKQYPSMHVSASILRRNCGQTPVAHAKYKDAIAACDNMNYIEYNVSQIARIFGVNPTGLGNQLRAHYPELIERRERERQRRGLADNQQRGVRSWCKEQYAEAVQLLRTTEMTVAEVAERCGVSFTGLRQHIHFYCKDVAEMRRNLREQAKTQKRKGRVTGSGRRHEPKPVTRERYQEAVRLYRDTPMTIKEICKTQGLNRYAFSSYLQTWHKEDVFARRGAEYHEGANLSETKQYKRPTAAKYAEAIARLKKSGLPTAVVAAEFGLHPDCFRQYLREHEPELHARQGMMTAGNGRIVSRRTMEKYAEALRLYETTDEPLISIARRLGLQYNSLGGFMRRNYPELIERHRRAVEREGECKAAGPVGNDSLVPQEAPALTADARRTERRAGSEAETILRYNSKI